MSDKRFIKLAKKVARVNTKVTKKFARDNARCFLLKRAPKSKEFTDLAELTEGFRVEYGELREDILLFYSTTDDMSDIWAQLTHIAYGVPDDKNQLFVYEIEPEQKERTLPDVISIDWKAFATRTPNDRYDLN
jgi:hypothetical protein